MHSSRQTRGVLTGWVSEPSTSEQLIICRGHTPVDFETGLGSPPPPHTHTLPPCTQDILHAMCPA
jgi:hypothetical protein